MLFFNKQVEKYLKYYPEIHKYVLKNDKICFYPVLNKPSLRYDIYKGKLIGLMI